MQNLSEKNAVFIPVEDRPLTLKQELFVKEYLIDFNGTRAAIAVGYSKKSAREAASEMLTKPNISKALSVEVSKLKAMKDVETEKIITELKKLAFADIKDLLSFDKDGVTFKNSNEVDGTLIQSVSSTTTEYTNSKTGDVTKKTTLSLRLWDKPKALEMLARYKAMFSDTNPKGVVNVNEVKTVIIQVYKNESIGEKSKHTF